MKKNFSIKNILMVQDSSPCIRNIKISSALKEKGLKIHLTHKDKTPDEVYGFGNNIFESLTKLPRNRFKETKTIKKIITSKKIELIHFHNQPDSLGAKLIKANLPVPVIYDQHDFMSFKHRLTPKAKKYEKICNEQADGTIYITESYRNEVGKYYHLTENSISFGNYFSETNTLNPAEFLPKLSKQNGEIHLVYIGRISEHKSDHRNIIEVLKNISEKGFIIHIYPSKKKKYLKYERIPNLFLHEKLPYRKLIREISQYDFGITVFNNNIAPKLPHIKFAFGNKTSDYICAGIPILSQDCLDEVKNFTLTYDFGFVLEQYDDYLNISKEKYTQVVEIILQNRYSFTMENQIQKMIDFYQRTLENFHAKT